MTNSRITSTPMRTLIVAVAIGLAALAAAGAAEARKPVTRAEVSAAAHRLAEQPATGLANQSSAGVEALTRGAASIDQWSVGNYMRYGKFRMGASFALFGTNTMAGVTRTLWCIGNLQVMRATSGRTGVVANVTCQ